MNEKQLYKQTLENLLKAYNLKNAIAYMEAVVNWRKKEAIMKIKGQSNLEKLIDEGFEDTGIVVMDSNLYKKGDERALYLPDKDLVHKYSTEKRSNSMDYNHLLEKAHAELKAGGKEIIGD